MFGQLTDRQGIERLWARDVSSTNLPWYKQHSPLFALPLALSTCVNGEERSAS